MVGWGIVGIGGIADFAMAPAIAKLKDGRLVGVVSRDQARADAFAQKHGAMHAYTRFDDLLRNQDVDVVVISTPNALHADQVVAAAEAGKHVLCDKPLATTVVDAERALNACHRAGVKLGINFQMRYFVPMRKTRDLIDAGQLGRIIAIQAEQSAGARGLLGWRADRQLAGMGSVTNIGVHLYDLLRFLLRDEVTEVLAMFDTGQDEALETLAAVVLRFSNGTLAYTNSNQNTPFPQNNIDIYGSKGRVVGVRMTREGDGELRTLVEGAEEQATAYNTDDAYDRLVAAFNEAVISDREPDASGLDGLRCAQIVDAIARSAREGRLVRVSNQSQQ